MQKILLLEDERDLLETLCELLEENGYSVTPASTIDEALDATFEGQFDLYVFDINLGEDMDGLELLESLHNAGDTTPTLFISALVDINSITKAFHLGAKDYIKKPFFPQELLVRIDAKFQEAQEEVVRYGDIVYKKHSRQIVRNNTQLPLTQMQQCLCEKFLENIGLVVDKALLYDCLNNPSDGALRVALNKLKQLAGFKLKNVRGVGYMLEKS